MNTQEEELSKKVERIFEAHAWDSGDERCIKDIVALLQSELARQEKELKRDAYKQGFKAAKAANKHAPSVQYSPYVDVFHYWCECFNKHQKDLRFYETTAPISFAIDTEGNVIWLESPGLFNNAKEVNSPFKEKTNDPTT